MGRLKSHPRIYAIGAAIVMSAGIVGLAEGVWSAFSPNPMVPSVYDAIASVAPTWPRSIIIVFWAVVAFLGSWALFMIFRNTRTDGIERRVAHNTEISAEQQSSNLSNRGDLGRDRRMAAKKKRLQPIPTNLSSEDSPLSINAELMILDSGYPTPGVLGAQNQMFTEGFFGRSAIQRTSYEVETHISIKGRPIVLQGAWIKVKNEEVGETVYPLSDFETEEISKNTTLHWRFRIPLRLKDTSFDFQVGIDTPDGQIESDWWQAKGQSEG